MSATQTTALNSKTNPRILIVGNAGQLGRELEKIFAGFGPIVGVNRESVDLADAGHCKRVYGGALLTSPAGETRWDSLPLGRSCCAPILRRCS